MENHMATAKDVTNLFGHVKHTKIDWKQDWKENTRVDWDPDWEVETAGHLDPDSPPPMGG
jgi:hypothetical protein